jgi:uncharacterized protein YhbP (UPF0306 family)
MFLDLLSLSTMSLCTCSADGAPHVAPVYFASDEKHRLYFYSDPESQHSLDLARDRRAATAIYPECHSWQEIRGMQLHGEVHPVPPGDEADLAWKLYSAKFPFVEELKEVVMRTRLYVFVPSWMRLVDNRQGFGYKQEWTLP